MAAAMPADDWIRLALTLAVGWLWTDNLLRSYRLWNTYRDARAFRAFLIGFLIELGVLVYLFTALGRIEPTLMGVAGFLAQTVIGSLLVVGIFTYVSWRRK